MNIGQAAAATGVSAKRIRYYEQIGLLPATRRSEAGYRVYEDAELHTLRFISSARRLGFSIPQITTLLDLWRDEKRSNAAVRKVARVHIDELENKISEMQAMVDVLTDLADRCHHSTRPACPILDELERSAT
jgi:MerR family copper efflux transcriptional regulator